MLTISLSQESEAISEILPPELFINAHVMEFDKIADMGLGEHDDEVLLSTSSGFVARRCIPGTGCNSSVRDAIMMHGGGAYLRDVACLRSRRTYLVLSADDFIVYECPLASTSYKKSNCENFMGGSGILPRSLLVDPIKGLVFVSDSSNSVVYVFSSDRTYLGPLSSTRGDLSQPSSMARRPGLYAPLSHSLPPSSQPIAGVRIESSLLFLDAYNVAVPESHPTSAHDLALEVSATGFITGTNFTTTITGEIL